MAEGLCWCASDKRCPHGISTKLPGAWEELENIVDDVLQQFDRKSVKRYLRKDMEGNTKPEMSGHLKEPYKNDDDLRIMMDKTKPRETQLNNTSPEISNRKRRSDALDSPLRPKTMSAKGNNSKRPATGLYDTSSNNNNDEIAMMSKSTGMLPKLNSSSTNPPFTRDLMNSKLPKIPPKINGLSSERKQAWASPSVPERSDVNATESEEYNSTSIAQGIPKTNPLNPLQAETTISTGLMRIAEHLARKILPWQAVLCPRALETLQDLRLTIIQTKHNGFMNQMKLKLEDKVSNFMKKKEEEVDLWVDNELKTWQKFLANDENDLTEYIKNDLDRITERTIKQEHAYRIRELTMANDLDDHERDTTREQLVNFRRIVRAAKQAQPGTGTASLFDPEPKHVEVRVLQDSIAKGQHSSKKKTKDLTRTVLRKQEECHDWLSSLADNAVTAAMSEEKLKLLYAKLDSEKTKSLDSLHIALATYKEQHNSILEAIVVFAGRIHQHASDYLQREQLVSRAFLQYLLAIISGEIKTHTAEQKKSSYAWETKSLMDRAQRKEIQLISEFHTHIDPLNRLVSEFKEKMRLQMEHITMKLQSVVNGKENDVNARKAIIHKKLAKHVNKACNTRRQRLKDATAVRRDEFELESLALSKVEDICGDLRSSIDSIWVKEHLKERKIYEASMGRLERMEKSALIIWNKHAHLTDEQKEEYKDWLEAYRQDRDDKLMKHKDEIQLHAIQWKRTFDSDFKSMTKKIRQQIKYFYHELIPSDLDMMIQTPLGTMLDKIDVQMNAHQHYLLQLFHGLQGYVEEYLTQETVEIESFHQLKQNELLAEWRDHLFSLDSVVNRRIGSLKDMEHDLEETIKLTIIQHEVENNVFEQLSCTRMEYFWNEWMKKKVDLQKELFHTQEDYEVAKRRGKAKARPNKKDRKIDDLVTMAKEQQDEKTPNKPIKLQPIGSNNKDKDKDTSPDPDSIESTLSDTMRLKILLDDIQQDVYKDFVHKLTRGLERVRRDLGEGKKQIIPGYAVLKVLLINCERFYEKAKLDERCIGRISSKGVLLFQEGLPMHAKAIFALGSSLSFLSLLHNPIEFNRFDCDEIFSMAENMKVFFMIGLLTITSQFGDYGEYMIKNECLWACSIFDIIPPIDLLRNNLAKGFKESIPKNMPPTGIFSEDPSDLFNNIIQLPTDYDTVKNLSTEYDQYLSATLPVSPGVFESMQSNIIPGDSQSLAESMTEDPSRAHAYVNNSNPPFNQLSNYMHNNKPSLTLMIEKLRNLIPANDLLIFVAVLGHPDGSFDLTTHRVCQMISIWRRTSFAILTAVLSPPSSEYPRFQDIINAHQATITGKKRMGYGNIHCLSPFEAVSMSIDYVTSIYGLPISILQALSLLSKDGSCDPWFEDPKQSLRHERLIYALQEFMEVMAYRIPKSMIHEEYLQVALPKTIESILAKLDLNFSGVVSLETLRSFLQGDEIGITHIQLTMVFWALCRINDDFDDNTSVQHAPPAGDKLSTVEELSSYQSYQSNGGGSNRPIVNTYFNADSDAYMAKFSEDVDRYLNSMPSIDANVVVGYLNQPLSLSAAHELVSDAMKLDPSARNPMPSTCSVWLGQRMIRIQDLLSALVLPNRKSKDGNLLLGVTRKPFSVSDPHSLQAIDDELAEEEDMMNQMKKPSPYLVQAFIQKTRVYTELDILTKYPEICEIRASDRFYGPGGNEPMTLTTDKPDDYYWKELLHRRMHRLDRLMISWRDIMLNEWAASLYLSRQMRYQHRIQLIQKSVSVYHTQYHSLRTNIISERNIIVSLYPSLENELASTIQEDYLLLTYHTSFLHRLLKRFEGEYERFLFILKNMLLFYNKHAKQIIENAIQRVEQASLQLQYNLETSCNGLILGYTQGYAQDFFNRLIQRGETWRNKVIEIQGQLIVMKEQFMMQKDEIDRDLTIQITDKLTFNRNQCKGHLEEMNVDTSLLLDKLATTRNNYSLLQKDANERLLLRIEKAIRESRKLRAVGEAEPSVEEEVLRDIRQILTKAKDACISIVDQIRDKSIKQLSSIEPLRAVHREKFESKIANVTKIWKELETVLFQLIRDYEKEVFKQLQMANVKGLDMIQQYSSMESRLLTREFIEERDGLILAFRKHFREYDLCEAAIFEEFNREIHGIIQEMINLWGPSRPKVLTNGLKQLQNILKESYQDTMQDIVQHILPPHSGAQGNDEGIEELAWLHNNNSNNANNNFPSSSQPIHLNDDITLSRMELCDNIHYTFLYGYQMIEQLSVRFIRDKQTQIEYVDNMNLQKNGDMVRPQVKAVLDLLISGIEIDHDFYVGYDNLQLATRKKHSDMTMELNDFVEKYNSIDHPVSIPYTAQMNVNKIDIRKQEMQALLDASNAHVIADHSKMEVLVQSSQKDIDEWTNLTLQLIETTFHNAEINYLSHIWPTPNASPREIDIPPDNEDEEARVTRLKEMLANNSKQIDEKSNALFESYNIRPTNNNNTNNNLQNYTGDAKLLMEQLQITQEEEDEANRRKELKRLEKERKKQQKLFDDASSINSLSLADTKSLPTLQTKELQDGWFQCHAPEGYIYYFNPDTGESLWDLPQALKKPLHADDDSSVEGFTESPTKLLDTPRELLLLDAANLYPEERVPIRVVPENYQLTTKIDPKLVMSEVTEEARAVANFVVDTAVDITDIIYGKRGRDTRTIATLLGDRYNPELVVKLDHKFDDRMMEIVASKGEEDAEEAALAELERSDPILKLMGQSKSGHVLSDTHSNVDSEVAQQMLTLGLGEQSTSAVISKEDLQPPIVVQEIVRPEDWLALSLGEVRTDKATNENEDEMFPGFHNLTLRSNDELKYMETRETDLMTKEDHLSIAYENYMENENCQTFLHRVQTMMDSGRVTDDDKKFLWKLSLKIKPINCMDIFSEFKLSWAKIDQMIVDTKTKDALRQQEIDELKTFEGKQRQLTILEHAEDIQEMTQFFHDQAGISKVKAKKIATELIFKSIATPKKLAKVWSRNEISLDQFSEYMDLDDREELENALRGLVMGSSMNSSSGILPPSANYSPFASAHDLARSQGSFTSLANINQSNTVFGLDPSMVTEVEEEYDNEDDNKSVRSQRSTRSQNAKSLYTITKDGYKSFHGGWIEGVSDKNEIYYYNVKTGQSLWNLPEAIADEIAANEAASLQGSLQGSLQASPSPSNASPYLDPSFKTLATTIRTDEVPMNEDLDEEDPELPPPEQVLYQGEQGIVNDFLDVAFPERISPALEGSYTEPISPHLEPSYESYHTDPNYTEDYHNYDDYYANQTNTNVHEDNLGYNYPQYQPEYPPQDTNQEYYDPNAVNNNNAMVPYGQDLQSTYQQNPNYQYYDPNQQQYPYDPNAHYDPNQAYQQPYYDPNDPNAYYDPNTQYQDPNAQFYDPNNQYYDPNNRYYDPNQAAYPAIEDVPDPNQPYQTDGTWKISDALGVDHIWDYQPPPKPRAIPSYPTVEVLAYSKKEGVDRQLILLQQQDRWQNNLVKIQHLITEQKTLYLNKRVEMFQKVSTRVESRLNAFVEDIKFMQKALKKELGDANASERDLRRLFEEEPSHASSQEMIRAEKLSFILESLEKLKISVSEKYDSAFKQIDKFAADWELIKAELLQVGDIYDEGIASNLEQCKLACQHHSKLFAYDQIKQTSTIQKQEHKELRKHLHVELRKDTKINQTARINKRATQLEQYQTREHKREELRRYYQEQNAFIPYLEEELNALGYLPLTKEEDLLTEEELVMSFILTQLEMEFSLQQDYASIQEASKNMAKEFQETIDAFDTQEKESLTVDGSWFTKHRDTLERHEEALHITLNKVRNRMNEGYQVLQSRIEALDYEVEHAAEEELFQGSIDHSSVASASLR